MDIFYVIIAVIIFIIGVVGPTVKRMMCTQQVNGVITDKRKVLVGNGKGFYRRTKANVTYSYNGVAYTVSMFLQFENNTNVKLLINPKHPKQWVTLRKNTYHSYIAFSIIGIVFLLFLGFFQ